MTDEKCWIPVAAGGGYGVAVCQLPKDHEGPCDGGERERQIGEAFAAQMLGELAELRDV